MFNIDINFAQEVKWSNLFVVMALNVVADRFGEVQVDPAHLLQEEVVSDHLETSPNQLWRNRKE